MKHKFENDVITIDMNSAEIHLLNYQFFIHTQPFLFFDKSTGPILPFVVLPLYCMNCLSLTMIFFNTWDIPCFGTTFYFLSAILTRTITCITLHTFLVKTNEKD